MDPQAQTKQQWRRRGNPSSRKNSAKHHRRQQWRRPWPTRNKMDQTRMQTKKYSHRSFLWPPRKRKNRESQRNIHHPKQTDRTEGAVKRNTRCKCKQDSVGVRRILMVPRDSVGASAGFCWCIWGEMADEVAAPCKSTATQGRAALRMR